MNIPLKLMIEDKAESKITKSQEELNKSMDIDAIHGLDGDNVDLVSATSSSNELNFNNIKVTLTPIQQPDSQSSTSLPRLDSPILSEKSNSMVTLTSSSSAVSALTSWLGINNDESKTPTVPSLSIESSVSVSEFDPSSDLKTGSYGLSTATTFFSATPKLLLEVDDSGYGGGPCSAGATALLDFIREVLADLMIEEMKAAQVVVSVLEMVPLYVEAEPVLVFQGLRLSRLMNFLERHLLCDDEEDEKKLD
ncbi:hypothetical protein SLA2020_107590 [Shorea laevis]